VLICSVVVATGRWPDGQPVPIAWGVDASDQRAWWVDDERQRFWLEIITARLSGDRVGA
jgi:hypothetical protein